MRRWTEGCEGRRGDEEEDEEGEHPRRRRVSGLHQIGFCRGQAGRGFGMQHELNGSASTGMHGGTNGGSEVLRLGGTHVQTHGKGGGDWARRGRKDGQRLLGLEGAGQELRVRVRARMADDSEVGSPAGL